MKLAYDVLRDKILGCWNGKNAGGVVGAPFEAKRGVFDIDFYVQKDINGNPPANDDLDLQLLWLCGVERFGRQINSDILADYWMSYIIPNWAEYGTAKNNMRGGMKPPVSGKWNNNFGQSCGCFIRSELWACLAPGHPEIAVRLAYEDAICDHWGEGVYGELFCAALESAAFVENDLYKLVEIAFSYIPENCQVAKAVKIAMDCYNSGKTWQEARKAILTETPGTFGIQNVRPCDVEEDFPEAEPGCDAPSNIGLTILGILYGEGDFGKSLCIAVNCGEDTDCTAATLGAMFGIIHGNSKLPEKWMAPIGNKINTKCINVRGYVPHNDFVPLLPKTTDELTDRTLACIPSILDWRDVDMLSDRGLSVMTAERLENDHENLFPIGCGFAFFKKIDELINRSPYQVENHFNTFNVILDYMGDPTIKVGEPRKLGVIIRQTRTIEHQQFMKVRLYTSSDLYIPKGYAFAAPLNNTYGSEIKFEFEVYADELTEPDQFVVVDVSVADRHSDGICKFVLHPAF